MGIVVSARKTEKGTVLHELGNGQVKEYAAVRGGLAWPVMGENYYLPPFLLIFGEEYVTATRFEGQETPRGRLAFLDEFEAANMLDLGNLFEKISDDLVRFGCSCLYTILEVLQEGQYAAYAETLRKEMYKRGISSGLQEAPYADNPDLGVYFINSWRNKGLLELPEGSLVRDQLKTLEAEQVKQLPMMFNRVNALRFVVGGFEKYDPRPRGKDWRKRKVRGSWQTA